LNVVVNDHNECYGSENLLDKRDEKSDGRKYHKNEMTLKMCIS